MSLVHILILILVIAAIAGLPTWRYAGSWGYGPSGILGIVVVILVVLLLLRVI